MDDKRGDLRERLAFLEGRFEGLTDYLAIELARLKQRMNELEDK